MVHWFIQDDKLPERENLQRIIYIIEELGMTAHVHPYIPFGGMDYSFLPDDEPVIALGGISMAKDHHRRKLPARPFVWFDEEKLKCSHYFAYYDADLVSRRYAFVPYAALVRAWDWFFDRFGADDLLFIKPDTNDKVFNGEVVNRQNKKYWEGITSKNGDQEAHQLCLMSEPINIKSEWRLFVADGEVIAGSRYKENGIMCKEEGYPKEAAQVAERLFAKWSPHPIMCMDIGQTSTGYKIIEIGSANCAGFYESDLYPIIESMAKIAEREYESSICRAPSGVGGDSGDHSTGSGDESSSDD
jgi:hypothetical protein